MKRIIFLASISFISISIQAEEAQQSQEIAPGVTISFNVSNPHEVQNHNAATPVATPVVTQIEKQSQQNPQIIQHVIVVKHEQENSIKSTLISLVTTCIPIGISCVIGRTGMAITTARARTATAITSGTSFITGKALRESGKLAELIAKLPKG